MEIAPRTMKMMLVSRAKSMRLCSRFLAPKFHHRLEFSPLMLFAQPQLKKRRELKNLLCTFLWNYASVHKNVQVLNSVRMIRLVFGFVKKYFCSVEVTI